MLLSQEQDRLALREDDMARTTTGIAVAVLAGLAGVAPALAQKAGGVLRSYNSSNPPSASIIEEATIATAMAFSGVYNNLLIFDQGKPTNGFDTIQPELAESWSWDDSKTRLTVKLRQGVKWHDGKPFTAKDVQCTWNKIQGKDPDTFRNSPPRAVWWSNLKEVTTSGDFEATFVLARPQASFPTLLASNLSPVYPCHVSAKDMRTKPIGTGPFKLAAFESNRSIKLVKNTEYWKPGLPYLDGVEFSIIGNRSTRILAFGANEFELTFVADITVPLMGEVLARSPKAICQLVPTGVSTNLIVNRDKPPFDNDKLRKAMALALDRQGMIDILSSGKSSIAGAMMPLPEGGWGMPEEILKSLPTYGGDLATRQAEARKIMQDLGYGPSKRLKMKVSTRDFQSFKDPAVLLVDQLNKIYFEAELEIIESAVWYGRITRQDYAVGLNLTGSGVDDPDVTLVEGYACKSDRNYTKYCNADVERLLEAQSQEADVAKRKQLVWQIEKVLAEEVARPIILHGAAATCWHPHLKGHVQHENSIYNNWRFESVWLDK
jgi:peptide/nickel transport system substrate-binding protein